MIEKILTFTSVGLTYDLAGVIVLGMAFFRKGRSTILAESESRYDYNSDILKSLIISRIDGILGSILLMMGFFLQLLGYLGFNSMWSVVVAYGWLLLGFTAYSYRLREILVRRECAAVMAMRNAGDKAKCSR